MPFVKKAGFYTIRIYYIFIIYTAAASLGEFMATASTANRARIASRSSPAAAGTPQSSTTT